MKIYIGSDHGGFELKEKLKEYLKIYKVEDLGNIIYDKKDDYPLYAARVAINVVKNKGSKGILICSSGEGMCITANKVKGVRAILAENLKDAYLSRKDDDANIICLQGRYIKVEDAKKIIKKFLETKFDKKVRYKRRIKEIKELEKL